MGTIQTSFSVKVRMHIAVYVGLAVVLLSVAGCANKAATKNTPPSVTPTKGSVSPTPEVGKGGIGTGAFTPSPVPPGTYEIGKPKEKGWSSAPLTLASLGKSMDMAMRDLERTIIESVTNFDDPEWGSMRATPDVFIEDEHSFRIIYTLPGDVGEDRLLIGDGKRRVERLKSKWTSLNPFSASPSISSKDAVNRWPLEFPSLMFALYNQGADIWGPLLDGWQSGKGGFKATVEEQTFEMEGKKASHFRVLATRGGAEPASVEVIVDKERLLPLTIRVQMTRKGGKELKAMWSGRWKFKGKHDPNSFLIPVAANN